MSILYIFRTEKDIDLFHFVIIIYNVNDKEIGDIEMIILTNIPKNMDKQIYIKHLSKEYKMPLDMIYCLIKECNEEQEFYKLLEWNLQKNGFGWRK